MTEARIIDADAHFYEPQEVFSEYLEPEFRWAAPRMTKDNMGRVRIAIAGEMSPFIAPPTRGGPRMETRVGAADANARLADMNAEGIDVMVCYPTKGLYFYSVKDAAINRALCNAYNRWASDQFAVAPGRIIGPCLVPQGDPGGMIAEAEFGLKQLGLKGVMLRPNPIGGRSLDHAAFEPLWDLLEEVGAPLILHEGTTMDVPQFGSDRWDNFLYKHMVSHPFEQMAGVMTLICGGVLERHPKLNVVVAECGVGWIPYWLDRMDDHHEHWGHASGPLKELPSYYFRRQCFATAEGAERLLPFVVDAFGDDNLCFSTDYPHQDHPFEGVVAGLKEMEGISEESRAKILGQNAARLFSL